MTVGTMAHKLRNHPLSFFTSHREDSAISHSSFVISYPPYIQGLLLRELKSVLGSVPLGFLRKDQWRRADLKQWVVVGNWGTICVPYPLILDTDIFNLVMLASRATMLGVGA